MKTEFEEVKDLIRDRLEINRQAEPEEEQQFILVIAERVAELMESNMELFFNHLYRMDVDERKIASALSLSTVSNESVYVTIARLIFERQKQRLETREKFKQDPIDFWAED